MRIRCHFFIGVDMVNFLTPMHCRSPPCHFLEKSEMTGGLTLNKKDECKKYLKYPFLNLVIDKVL